MVLVSSGSGKLPSSKKSGSSDGLGSSLKAFGSSLGKTFKAGVKVEKAIAKTAYKKVVKPTVKTVVKVDKAVAGAAYRVAGAPGRVAGATARAAYKEVKPVVKTVVKVDKAIAKGVYKVDKAIAGAAKTAAVAAVATSPVVLSGVAGAKIVTGAMNRGKKVNTASGGGSWGPKSSSVKSSSTSKLKVIGATKGVTGSQAPGGPQLVRIRDGYIAKSSMGKLGSQEQMRSSVKQLRAGQVEIRKLKTEQKKTLAALNLTSNQKKRSALSNKLNSLHRKEDEAGKRYGAISENLHILEKTRPKAFARLSAKDKVEVYKIRRDRRQGRIENLGARKANIEVRLNGETDKGMRMKLNGQLKSIQLEEKRMERLHNKAQGNIDRVKRNHPGSFVGPSSNGTGDQQKLRNQIKTPQNQNQEKKKRLGQAQDSPHKGRSDNRKFSGGALTVRHDKPSRAAGTPAAAVNTTQQSAQQPSALPVAPATPAAAVNTTQQSAQQPSALPVAPATPAKQNVPNRQRMGGAVNQKNNRNESLPAGKVKTIAVGGNRGSHGGVNDRHRR